MPHLTLEYTDNITQGVDFPSLFSALHGILADEAGIQTDNCKSRCLRLDTYQVGLGAGQQAFVHLTMRILEGRPLEVRKAIAQRALALLEKTYNPSLDRLHLQITVEVTEMQRETYFKAPSVRLGERRNHVRAT